MIALNPMETVNKLLLEEISDYLKEPELCLLSRVSREFNVKYSENATWIFASAARLGMSPEQYAAVQQQRTIESALRGLPSISDKDFFVKERSGLKFQGKRAWVKGIEKGCIILKYPQMNALRESIKVMGPILGNLITFFKLMFIPQGMNSQFEMVAFMTTFIAIPLLELSQSLFGLEFTATTLQNNTVITYGMLFLEFFCVALQSIFPCLIGNGVAFIFESCQLPLSTGVGAITALLISGFMRHQLRTSGWFRDSYTAISDIGMAKAIAQGNASTAISTINPEFLIRFFAHESDRLVPQLVGLFSGALMTMSVVLPMIYQNGKKHLKKNRLAAVFDIGGMTTALLLTPKITPLAALAIAGVSTGVANCTQQTVFGIVKTICGHALGANLYALNAIRRRAFGLLAFCVRRWN